MAHNLVIFTCKSIFLIYISPICLKIAEILHPAGARSKGQGTGCGHSMELMERRCRLRTLRERVGMRDEVQGTRDGVCGIYGFLIGLFVVIGFVVYDGHGAVELFCEYETYHFVRKGHFGE